MKRTILSTALFATTLAAPGLVSAFSLDGVGYVQYGDAESYSLPIAQIQYDGTVATSGDEYYVASSPGKISDFIVVATGGSGTPVRTNTEDPPTSMDDAYETPNGVNQDTSEPYFSPDAENVYKNGEATTVADPDPDKWDISLASLYDYLDADDDGVAGKLVWFFNNNQTDSGGSATQSLAAWAQITLTTPDGTIINMKDENPNWVGAYDLVNTFVTNPTDTATGYYATVTEGGGGLFDGNVNWYTADPAVNDPRMNTSGDNGDGTSWLKTDYVLSGGEICVATRTGEAPIPVPCDFDQAAVNEYLYDEYGIPYDAFTLFDKTINHNLGANQAVYALVFPELNAQMDYLFGLTNAELNALLGTTGLTLADLTLHLDVRLGCEDPDYYPDQNSVYAGTYASPDPRFTDKRGTCLNNGYEQIFLVSLEQDIPNVPEPASLALIGAGLLGFGAVGMRRRRRS